MPIFSFTSLSFLTENTMGDSAPAVTGRSTIHMPQRFGIILRLDIRRQVERKSSYPTLDPPSGASRLPHPDSKTLNLCHHATLNLAKWSTDNIYFADIYCIEIPRQSTVYLLCPLTIVGGLSPNKGDLSAQKTELTRVTCH